MRLAFVACLAVLISTNSAQAADKPVVGAPPAAWVSQTAAPKPASTPGSEAVKLLLYDLQIHLGPEGISSYIDTMARVQTPQGLGAIGAMGVSWNPDLDQVAIHKLHLIRDGQVIDVLAKQSFTTLRRETNLEMAALDGRLTAVLQPEDVRVGDLVEFSYTVTRKDPALAGRLEDMVALPDGQVDDLRVSVDTDAKTPFHWRRSNDIGATTLKAGEDSKLFFEVKDSKPVHSPEHGPVRYAAFPHLELTTFKSWADVSTVMAPLYTKAEVLQAGSPLTAEVARIKALSSDPKVQAEAALALVQDQIRYLALSMNDGGLVPAGADVTWSRRFGDCKGKTVLLLSLLHALGIEAQPALVNSGGSDGLDLRLPAIENFDHVIVRATIAGRPYWLDGTRQGDSRLDEIQTPPFVWALPVQASGATLVRMVQTPLDKPAIITTLRLDASAGLDAPAPAHGEVLMSGDAATAMNMAVGNLAPTELENGLKTYWSGRYDFIKVKTVTARFDPKTRQETFVMDGIATLQWDEIGAGYRYEANDAVLGWKPDFDRLDGPGSDAPYLVGPPSYDEIRETVILPHEGKGFTLQGKDEDVTAAGHAFHRASRIDKGVFTMVVSNRTLVPEVPASQVEADTKALKALIASDVYIRAPADYQRDKAELSTLRQSQPTTAEGYLDRGYILLDSGDAKGAEADFRKAIALDPKSADAVGHLAFLEIDRKDWAQAKSDIATARALDPQNVIGFQAQGYLAEAQNQQNEAIAAYSSAIALEPSDDYSLSRRANLYLSQQKGDLAFADASALLKIDPDSQSAKLVRIRALSFKNQAEEAMIELEPLLAKNPDDAYLHQIRELLFVQLKRFSEARTEVDRVIAIHPSSTAYVARAGLKSAANDSSGALADLAAAAKLDPDWPAIYDERAQLNIRLARYDDAMKDIAKLITLTPDDLNPRGWRAELYVRLKKPDLAAEDYAWVRTRISTSASGLNSLCWAEARLNVTPDLALKDCDASLALKPDDGATLDSRGLALIRLARYTDAIAAYDLVLKQTGDHPSSLYGRGLAKQKAGVPGGEDDLAAARKADPKIEATYAEMGLNP